MSFAGTIDALRNQIRTVLPADITGPKIYDHATTSFKTIEGPIFSNFVLADEINRAPILKDSKLGLTWA